MKTSFHTSFAYILIVALTVPLCALFAQSTTFEVAVPAQAVMFFANVVTEDGLVASTRVFDAADLR